MTLKAMQIYSHNVNFLKFQGMNLNSNVKRIRAGEMAQWLRALDT